MKNPIETCKSFRGTSCRCTNDLHCLCIGIRPSGLGLRLKSLQLQPELALVGDRWPFDVSPLGVTGGGFVVAVEDAVALAGVRAVTFRILMGLLLFDLALLRSALVSSSSSRSSCIGCGVAAFFFFADLVTGPKYPSCEASRASEGVGEGEMTLGVAGIGFEEDRDMVKGGSEGIRIAPVSIRWKSARLKNQLVEWRCLSLREARMLTEGKAGKVAIGSSGRRTAGPNCAASLEKDMMLSGAPSRGTSICGRRECR